MKTILLSAILLINIVGCESPTDLPIINPCQVQGYFRTTFIFPANNDSVVFMTLEGYGSIDVDSHFGGTYMNTCDSIRINLFNNSTHDTLKLDGILSSNKSFIKGEFQSLVYPTESGNFSMLKQ